MPLLRSLASRPRTISADASLAEAARILEQGNVATLVVLRAGEPSGSVTHGEIERYCQGSDETRRRALVAWCSTSPLRTIRADAALGEATAAMRRFRVRRLGLTEGEELVGLVSLEDLLRQLGLRGYSVHDALQRELHEHSALLRQQRLRLLRRRNF